MNKEEALKMVKVVNNIKNTSPLLLVGEYHLIFRQKYKGKVIEINKDNIKEIVEYYSQITLNYPLVLEDISNLSANNINYLLKLIEEAKYPIILLASYDNMNSILLSRVKTFLKLTDTITSDFKIGKEAIELLDNKIDKEMGYKDKINTIGEVSPMYFRIERQINNVRNKDKYINILM